ncbi:MAG: glycoside hydrolase family 76 protein [Terriglobia bacterium]|nr:glycoside hydrolase family 76 protein [Terriglobia bacterium]
MLIKMIRQTVFLSAICILIVPACAGTSPSSSSNAASAPGYAQQATEGVQTLQQWYVQGSGLYAAPSGWWNAANAMTVLANYSRVTASTQYLPAIANTFTQAQTAHANFLNLYDDDEGWWALAWIDAYDLTGNPAYLTMAETIFADISTEWDTTTCGGGVWWKKPADYKNAIANELFLAVAASLANRTTGTASASYLAWAQKEWTWFKASGMINSQSLVNDGLTSTNPTACTNNGRTTWSYNQGVILGGLVELAKADQDPTLLPQAESIANAAIANLTVNGILVDPSVSGGDTPQFKGVFVRNLMALYAAAPNPQFKTFVDSNANSIWTNDQGPKYQFGALWQGPFDSADATRQTSALDALVAAAAMQ